MRKRSSRSFFLRKVHRSLTHQFRQFELPTHHRYPFRAGFAQMLQLRRLLGRKFSVEKLGKQLVEALFEMIHQIV